MWGRSERTWVAERVAKVREARRRQGHELSRLQEGIVQAVAASDPNHDPDSRKALEAVRAAVSKHGGWEDQEEWRISTWFDTEIVSATHNGTHIYEVTVSCDGQRMSCACPTLEGAFAFSRLYQAFIVDQFYSIGPPWADTGIYTS